MSGINKLAFDPPSRRFLCLVLVVSLERFRGRFRGPFSRGRSGIHGGRRVCDEDGLERLRGLFFFLAGLSFVLVRRFLDARFVPEVLRLLREAQVAGVGHRRHQLRRRHRRLYLTLSAHVSQWTDASDAGKQTRTRCNFIAKIETPN